MHQKSSLKKLEEFCNENNWKVVYIDNIKEECKKNIIFLNPKRSEKVLLSLFLHEVGHMWMQNKDLSYFARYAEMHRKNMRYSSGIYKIEKIREEIEAWDVGKKLIEHLNLKIDMSVFERTRTIFLKRYFSWACKKRKRNR